MNVSFIGMSGSGKTFWSKRLEDKGFKRYAIDDIIERALADELKNLGFSGIQDVAAWMGQPFDKYYTQRSSRYLRLEKKALQEICHELENTTQKYENIVIDTTGSFIYIDESIIKKITTITSIIYLHTPLSIKKILYEQYIKDPKPVIWGSLFKKAKGESDSEALARCYPDLLEFRTKKYQQFADISFDYSKLRNSSFNTDQLIQAIAFELEQ